MTRELEALARLQRIARLKSDLEMRRFAAFRSHVEVARATVGRLGAELEGLYQAEAPYSIAEARLANALAGDCSRALCKAEGDLQRMLPGYELARQAATRAFGRAEALGLLRDERIAQDRQHRRRSGQAEPFIPEAP